MPRTTAAISISLLLSCSTVPCRAEQVPEEARQVIAELNAGLLDVLRQANELDYAGRFKMLGPTLDRAFDLPYMARQAVGRPFLDLDEGERQTWYELFRTYMTANYASRFDRFSGQSFEMRGSEAGTGDTVLIRTEVIDPAGENVDLSYRLRNTAAGWKVIDVFLKGTVSELALRRSEFASVLRREGFPALAKSIQARIDEFAAGTAPK